MRSLRALAASRTSSSPFLTLAAVSGLEVNIGFRNESLVYPGCLIGPRRQRNIIERMFSWLNENRYRGTLR
jgi:hypothetical protein